MKTTSELTGRGWLHPRHSNIRTFEHSNISHPHANIRTFEHSNISPADIYHKGFTIIELLVASLLLSMLVTILTMMFNQSSIAWRTGTAGIVNLNKTRSGLGTLADIRDDVLPGLGDTSVKGGSSDNRSIQYRTVSIWDKDNANTLRSSSERAYSTEGISWGDAKQFTLADAMTAKANKVLDKESGQSVSLFSVGVRSLGPDGKTDTADDITTWPEEID